MPCCIAKYCHVTFENNPLNAHFHQLVKKPAMHSQCLAKCGRPPWTDKEVCSLHFVDKDYHNFHQNQARLVKQLLLKSNAVPSIFS